MLMNRALDVENTDSRLGNDHGLVEEKRFDFNIATLSKILVGNQNWQLSYLRMDAPRTPAESASITFSQEFVVFGITKPK